MGNQVAETNQAGKNKRCPFQLQHFQIQSDTENVLFSSNVSAKEKLLSGKDSLFPSSFLLSDDGSRSSSQHRWSRTT